MLKKQKNAVAVTVATLVLGIFGAFLRWVQVLNLYEAETGLPRAGAGVSYLLLLFSAAAVAGMALLVLFTVPGKDGMGGAALLRAAGPLPSGLAWLMCALAAPAGLALMFSAGGAAFPALRRCLGAGAVAAGFCFPLLPYRGGDPSPGRTAGTCLTLFGCLWLVSSYRDNVNNALLWSYAPELVAISATTVAFCAVAGCHFDRAAGRSALLACQPAAYLDMALLSTAQSAPARLLFAACAGMLLLLIYLLTSNLSQGPEPEEAGESGDQAREEES